MYVIMIRLSVIYNVFVICTLVCAGGSRMFSVRFIFVLMNIPHDRPTTFPFPSHAQYPSSTLMWITMYIQMQPS